MGVRIVVIRKVNTALCPGCPTSRLSNCVLEAVWNVKSRPMLCTCHRILDRLCVRNKNTINLNTTSASLDICYDDDRLVERL